MLCNVTEVREALAVGRAAALDDATREVIVNMSLLAYGGFAPATPETLATPNASAQLYVGYRVNFRNGWARTVDLGHAAERPITIAAHGEQVPSGTMYKYTISQLANGAYHHQCGHVTFADAIEHVQYTAPTILTPEQMRELLQPMR